jgi:tRNA(Ile)-lysidine synthase TilS/MesJ
LPETFPGARIDEDGLCSFCREVRHSDDQDKKEEYQARFDELIRLNKGKSHHDAILCYSGGKDSTYTLRILREKYGLSVLAITFDNGFIPDQTRRNIIGVVEKLGVDHILYKPGFDFLSQVFRKCAEDDVFPPKTLERASTICTACMAIVKFTTLRLAVEEDIPFIAFGWSPGQAPITSSIMKNNPNMVKLMQKTLYDPLYRIAGNRVGAYFLDEKHFSGAYHFPYNVHPLAFLEYKEEDIYRSIGELGWKPPTGVDANSTNCTLNSFANVVHKRRFGYNPYAFELANLVRAGQLDRADALERLDREEVPETVAAVQRKLGL